MDLGKLLSLAQLKTFQGMESGRIASKVAELSDRLKAEISQKYEHELG